MVETTLAFDFDTLIERRGSGCVKWDFFEPDVLPLWVADMDFASPPAVTEALIDRARHGVFGYMAEPQALRDALCERMDRLYGWAVTPDQLVFVPGVVSGMSVGVRAFGQPGDNALTLTPVYPPFLMIPGDHGQTARTVDLTRHQDGSRLRYTIDFDALEAAIDDRTRTLMLCSPHNPVGRVWTRTELTRLAEISARHDLIILSDEIHGDLLLDGHTHTPIAALSPEISARTVTFMAPSKTFNLPGLHCSFAIIQDKALRDRFQKAAGTIMGHVNIMGFVGALAAYRDGGPWLDALRLYLTENRDLTTQFVEQHLPGVAITHPEGTYLSWVDFRALPPAEEKTFGGWIDTFFLKNARVALSAGGVFGAAGEGYVRLNFASPRSMLREGLERMRAAVDTALNAG
jgi:cystathionine beta-lyase